MIKKITVFILLTAVTVAFAEQNNNTAPASMDLFAGETQGQYVYYHDRRGNNNALVGIMKFNSTEYVARRYDMATGLEVVLQFRAVINNGDYEIVPVNYFAGDEVSSTALIVDLSNMASQYRRFAGHKLDEEILTDKWPEFGYTLKHSYRSWIPFFRLYRTDVAGDTGSYFSLLYVGRMQDGKDLLFFKLREIPRTVKYDVFRLAPEGETILFRHGMFSVPLDSNWKPAPNSNDIYKSYWIVKKGERDAVAAIEVIPGNLFKGDLISLVQRSICFSTWVLPSTVQITKKSDSITVSHIVLDPANMNETYMYSCYRTDGSGNIHVFHFSAFKEVYETNRDYFDNMINGVVVAGK